MEMTASTQTTNEPHRPATGLRLPRLRMPLDLSLHLGLYIARNKLRKAEKFPLVLMLEPLHACNLTCAGCGRIREYAETKTQMLAVEDCLRSADECGAPIVSICGGEPLIYPPIADLTRRLLERGKFIYLCTNGVLLRKKVESGGFRPHKRFFWNIHLDALEETHDRIVGKEGVFRQAVDGIGAAKAAGYQVCTNTTVYRETDMAEVEGLFAHLEPLRLDGHMLSPAYSYEAVEQSGIFMTRSNIHEKFRDVDRLAQRFNLHTTPLYLEFLKGERDFPCTAWGNPTRNILGWKSPCYLITDGHHATYAAMLRDTPWEKYGAGRDPRCEHCMVHCGFEPSAALGLKKRPGDTMKYVKWQLRL
jgi:hopanoid biosynthesis associated radical SAM protein HpnH